MTIENDFLRIQIKNTGAELGSLFNKETQTELLWQGDANYWSGQAPILFPTVGSLKEGKFIYENKEYLLPRHGLARRSNAWKIERESDTAIKCTLTSDKETLKVYPFDFELIIKYTLEAKKLVIGHEVKNTGTSKMPFSIGGHPAFNCKTTNETSYSDYYLEFEKEENTVRHFLNEDGFFNDETALVLDNTNKLQLSDTLFNDDALVFKKLKSKAITLAGKKGKVLKVSYADFKTIGIWAKPGAPFVCIEPWIGYADTVKSTQNLFDKEESEVLEAGKNFGAKYTIEAF